MKIALACDNNWGTRGGPGNFLSRITPGLNQISDLDIYISGSNKPYADFCLKPMGRSNLQHLLNLRYIRRRRDWRTLASNLYFDRQVSNNLKFNKYDLFIGVAGELCISFQVAKQQKIRRWLYCLNCYLPYKKQQQEEEIKVLGESIKDMHPKMLQRFVKECELADLILLNSEVAKKSFINAGFSPNKLIVLHPPVDSVRFYPLPKQNSVFRVLYVGTINPRKGVHYLIPGYLNAHIPNSELLLVGGVASRKLKFFVENILSKNTNIKQETWDFSRDEPAPIFGRCSVLVLPSVEDGFGLVALEAMACGLPVIVTSHCGAADIVENGKNGFVIPPRDPEAITQKLRFLADNEDIRFKMGVAARLTAEYYNQERYNRNLQKVLISQGLIAERKIRNLGN